jgi:hypothetical protein
MKNQENKTAQLGRPVNPTSARQIRLAEIQAKRDAGLIKRGRPSVPGSANQMKMYERNFKIHQGLDIKRGRPVNETSERQARLKKQAENKANGLGQGRPVNPNSARQLRLAELKAKAEANGGTVKRGRPAQAKGDEVAA